jgi:hypothetical protein
VPKIAMSSSIMRIVGLLVRNNQKHPK